MDVSPMIIFRKNHIDFMVTVMAEITTVELLLCDTSIQGTPPFRARHKLWSGKNKNVQIIIVSVTSIEGTPPYSGERDTFSGS